MLGKSFVRKALACSLAGALTGVVAVETARGPVQPARPAATSGAAAYGKLPLRFEPNEGQTDAAVRYLAHTPGGTLFLTDQGAILALRPGSGQGAQVGPPTLGGRQGVVRMRPLGVSAGMAIEPAGRLPGVANYLVGDRSRWRTGVAGYDGVRYRGVYRGIDLVFHGKGSALEYDFEVAPGADPNRIAVAFDGARTVSVDAKSGDLMLGTDAGVVRQARPVLYQDAAGGRRPVSGGFAVDGHTVRFRVGAYDHALPLVIDPVIASSALLGGSNLDMVAGLAVDGTGAAYVTGATQSTDFPTMSPVQGALAGTTNLQDIFVAKIGPDGRSLVYATYLGGVNEEWANGIAVDRTGAAYVTGTTASPDFPMAGNSFDPTCGADGACRYDRTFPDGHTTAGSTTLTSNQAQFYTWGDPTPADVGKTITGANLAPGTTIASVVDGRTVTLSQPATATGIAPFTMVSRDYASTEVVVAKLAPAGSSLAYATFLGGSSSDDRAGGITVDSDGNAYVVGATSSPDFPTTDGTNGTTRAYDRACGTGVDPVTGAPDGACNANSTHADGVATAGSTTYTSATGYFNNDDVGKAVSGTGIPAGTVIAAVVRGPDVPGYEPSDTVELSNAATVTGTKLAFGVANDNYAQPDAFVARVDTLASSGPASLAYSTFLGGGVADIASGVALDPTRSRTVYVGGASDGLGFPTTPTAFEPGCDHQLDVTARCTGGSDGFVVKLDTGLDGDYSLTSGDLFSTFLGGKGNNNLLALAADATGVYVVGRTDAVGFPTKNPFQSELSPNQFSQDAFVAKLVRDGSALVYSTFLGGTGADGAVGVALDGMGGAYVSGSTSSLDFPTRDSVEGPATGFLTKFSRTGTALDYSTYFNVAGPVATRPGENAVYVAGGVQAADFPAVDGSLRSGPGGGVDVAVAKLVPGQTPAVGSLTPRGGPTSGGTPVVIRGDNFTGATGVRFGGVPALSFTVDSKTQITAVSPPHAEGSIAELTTYVTVTGPQATSLSVGTARFVYGEGIFQPTGSCAGGRCPMGGQAVTLRDGRVLYVNGTGARFINDTLPASSQLYDPATGTWKAVDACTGCGFGDGFRAFSMTVLNDGRVLVAGGMSLPSYDATATAFLYDPVTGHWTQTGSMAQARQGHTATLLPNGKVLVAGGCAQSACTFGRVPLASAELYDPATGTWAATGAMTVGRHQATATLLDRAGGPCGAICGTVLVAFGSGVDNATTNAPGLPSAELYDPATGTWRETGSSLGSGRTRQSATRLADGRVLAVGGYGYGFFGPELRSAEIFDPATETWKLTGILNAGHGGEPALVALPNGRALLAGGSVTDIAEIWSPADRHWHSGTSSSFTMRNWPAVAVLLSGPAASCGANCGKVLLAGGSDPDNSRPPLAVSELYTPRPEVTGVAPASGPGEGGSTVTITGTSLASARSVAFGASAATGFTLDAVSPDTTLSAVTPPHGPGAVQVTVVTDGGASTSTLTPANGYTFAPAAPAPATAGATAGVTAPVDQLAALLTGYRLVAADGGLFNFGALPFLGSAGGMTLTKPVVGAAATPSGRGYWLVASDGGIFAFGDALFLGSTGDRRLNRPIVGMAATPSGKGYWLVASDGGVFAFGDAAFLGSTGDRRLNRPIVGMATTPSGKGYWLVASDGGIFAFGDARFLGSTGGMTLTSPVVGMAPVGDGRGYRLVASDGGVFAFGSATFAGSAGGSRLTQPVVGMAATPSGKGYWLVARDGGVFAYGDAPFLGSTGALHLNQPVVGLVGG